MTKEEKIFVMFKEETKILKNLNINCSLYKNKILRKSIGSIQVRS